MSELWPWVVLFLLGAYHGINPGMGWLFAVALGLQHQSRGAVLRAIPPVALGHAVSIGVFVFAAVMFQNTLPAFPLRLGAAGILFAFGVYRLVRSRHPRWVGMQVGFRDLTLWSFLMATAHGAGLMLVPVILGWPHIQHAHGGAASGLSLIRTQAAAAFASPAWLGPVIIHTLGYLVVAVLTALLVYEKFGVAILRRAWFNLDRLWAFALVVSGALCLVV